MKPKEIIQLTIALIVLVVAGVVIYGQLAPKQSASASGVTVEKITPIPASFSQDAMGRLTDTTQFRDFYVQPDLHSGLGNTRPFGPLQ